MFLFWVEGNPIKINSRWGSSPAIWRASAKLIMNNESNKENLGKKYDYVQLVSKLKSLFILKEVISAGLVFHAI